MAERLIVVPTATGSRLIAVWLTALLPLLLLRLSLVNSLALLLVFLFELLRLLLVSLLDLLGLLLAPLLRLLISRRTGILLRLSLVILLLFLLQFLMVLILLCIELLLLLLETLIQLRVSRIPRRGRRMRRKISCMRRRWRTRNIVLRTGNRRIHWTVSRATVCRMIRSPGFPCWNSVSAKVSRPSSRSNRRLSLIRRCPQFRVAASRLLMLPLRSHGLHMPPISCILFFAGWTPFNAAVSTVVTHMVIGVVVDDRRVIRVVNIGDVYVVRLTVIEEVIVIPSSTFVASTVIAVTVVNPTVEADFGAPVAFVKQVPIAAPTPIRGSPEVADFRCFHPGSRNPVIVVFAVSPIAGRPQVSIAGAERLLVNRQRRRTKFYRYTNLREG